MTIPMSRTTTPWKFPSTSTAVSGTDPAAAFESPRSLLRPLRKGPSADADMRRVGGSPRSTASSADAVVAPNSMTF